MYEDTEKLVLRGVGGVRSGRGKWFISSVTFYQYRDGSNYVSTECTFGRGIWTYGARSTSRFGDASRRDTYYNEYKL